MIIWQAVMFHIKRRIMEADVVRLEKEIKERFIRETWN